MLPGYEYVGAEKGTQVIPPNEVLSVPPPEGAFYLPRRIFAYLIDLFAQYTVVLGAFLGVMIILFPTLDLLGYPTSLIPDDLETGGLAISVILYSSVIRLKVICEGLSGQTLGKKMTGLIVVMEDGRSCTLWAAVIRSLATLIDSLFWGLVGLVKMGGSPWKRRYGDVWAKTVVLFTKQQDGQPVRGRIPFLAAFFISLLFEGILASLVVASQILSNPNGYTP